MTAIEVPPTVREVSSALRGATVLLVDDDADALCVLEDFLSATGARLITARSADEAMTAFAEHKPDVIVSDISMPDGDGYQLIRRVRARTAADGGTTPAIAVTAHTGATAHTRALLAGFQAHLGKPIKPFELVATIHQLVGTRD